MKKKKILIFAPILDRGGVEKNLFIIANHLTKQFHDVALISTSVEFKKKFNKKINFIAPKNYFINSLKNRRLKILFSMFLLIKYFFLSKEKFTVISFQANLYCCLVCKFLRVKVILRSNASLTGWYKGFFKKILYRKISKMADKIIVNSKEFQREYKKKFNVKTTCIYNPLDVKNIIKSSKKKINFTFFTKKSINFINIGRLVQQKDQLTLLKAFNILNKNKKYKFKLLIIGNGKNKNIILNYIFNNNLNKVVKVLNFKNNVYPYIKKADAFILSSIYEGLPNVLLESLALKKFIISTNCPTGPAEILDYGKGGLLFKVSDENDLLRKINFFIKNKKLCSKYINHAHKRLDRFNYDSNLKKYVKLLNA